MDKKYKLSILALACFALAITLSGVTPVQTSAVVPGSSPGNENYAHVGVVVVEKIDGLTGKVVQHLESHNLLTNYGSSAYARATNGTIENFNWTNMTLGGNTTALAVTDTDVPNGNTAAQGLGPADGIFSTVAVGNISLNYQWTSTGAAVYNVNVTCIYNSTGSAGKVIACAYFGSNVALNGANGDKLNVTYYRKVSGGLA